MTFVCPGVKGKTAGDILFLKQTQGQLLHSAFFASFCLFFEKNAYLAGASSIKNMHLCAFLGFILRKSAYSLSCNE